MKSPICPLLKKSCVERDCMFWVHLVGQHPQTGQPIDQFDCSFKWMPVIFLEGSKRTLGVQAAVESMRNEVTDRQDTLNHLITSASRRPAQIKDVDQAAQISTDQEKNVG